MNAHPRTDLVLPDTFAPPIRSRSRAQRAERPLVVLAEDDLDLRAMMCWMLRREQLDVIAATDGEDLLTLLSAASRGEMRFPDALVLDIRMPRHRGDEIVGALRRAGWTQPIVLMTGFASAVTRERAEEEGASAIVEKPVDTRALAALLVDLMRQQTWDPVCFAHEEEDRPPETLRSPRPV